MWRKFLMAALATVLVTCGGSDEDRLATSQSNLTATGTTRVRSTSAVLRPALGVRPDPGSRTVSEPIVFELLPPPLDPNFVPSDKVVPKYAPGEGGQRTVIGTDDREAVPDPAALPYRRVVRLWQHYQFGGWARCSGIMLHVGPDLEAPSPDVGWVLTAGHCLFDASDGYIDQVEVIPALSDYDDCLGDGCPYGVHWGKYIFVPPEYVASQDPEYDFGLLQLWTEPGVGYADWNLPMNIEFLDKQQYTAGYPTDLPGGNAGEWTIRSEGSVDKVTGRLVWHLADTMGGQSGSGMWHDDLLVNAEHTGYSDWGGGDVFNRAVRLRPEIINWMYEAYGDCTSECTTPSCSGSNAYIPCELGPDSCFDEGPVTACPPGSTCTSGECLPKALCQYCDSSSECHAAGACWYYAGPPEGDGFCSSPCAPTEPRCPVGYTCVDWGGLPDNQCVPAVTNDRDRNICPDCTPDECPCLDDSHCDDGLFCSGAETCVNYWCQAGSDPCDDGLACTADSCNEASDSCTNTPNDALCDNGLYCDGDEYCDLALGCQPGTAVDCADGVGCTNDTCNEGSDGCDHAPNDGLCADGLFCNGDETCDPILDCQPGTAVDCGDGVACTVDVCIEASDSCSNAPNHAACDNGVYCDGSEICDSGLGCQAGAPVDCGDGVACTTDVCNPGSDSCQNTPNDALCDNGIYCDGDETCDAVADCQPGTGVTCGDGVSCTVDSCNEATDSCDSTPNDALCDNGIYCDGDETCDALADCQPGTGVTCGDGVSCTVDSCNEATDSCDNLPNDALCDNGQFCDGAETCDPTADCQNGTAVTCGDGVGCTVDTCNESTDSCDHTPNDALCDNGQYCDGVETCDPTSDCQNGTAVDCGDGVGCTVDACNESNDSCDHTPNHGLCDNGQYCDGVETCDLTSDCQNGTAVDCGDGVSCTVDACNDSTDSCDHTPNDGLCDNGQYCDGLETCDLTSDCQNVTAVDCADGVGCTVDSCNEGTDSCDNNPNDALCDNGQYCDGAETCDPSADCQAGPGDPCSPPLVCSEASDACVGCTVDADCDDGVDCTVDSCDTSAGNCVNAPNDAFCDNGQYCDGAEVCNPNAGCQAGTPVSCDDGVGCTADSCNEMTDNCEYLPDHNSCDDTLFCTGVETCDVNLDCRPGMNPCAAGETCDEANDACVGCLDNPDCDDGVACTVDICTAGSCSNNPDDAVCDDGQYCNGAETCTGTGCLAGTAPNCDDGVGCTENSCDESADSCSYSANDANCDDGQYCNGTESCHATQDCQAGTPVSCNDGTICTVDSCDESADACEFVPDHASCDNGQYCDGVEVCDPVAGCQVGAEPCAPPLNCDEAIDTCVGCVSDADCDDGLACTADSCDPGSGTCVNTPDDSACDDGLYCNGAESCLAGLGCQDGVAVVCDDGVSCTADVCDEATDACASTPDDGSCDNGLYCDGSESCDALLDCQDGIPVECEDGIDCTSESCSEAEQRCQRIPDDTACDDGNPCTDDSCDLAVGCQSTNNSVPCDDDNDCTMNDGCVNGVCHSDPLDADGDGYGPENCGGADCDDSDETVNPGEFEGGTGSASCTDGIDNDCDGLIDDQEATCADCVEDQDCDDSNPCNGEESCAGGSCMGGTPLDCDDANACTDDSCDPATGCVNAYNTDPCDDLDDCSMNDTCSVGECSGEPLDLDGDGSVAPACGGDDCDDSQASVNPGIFEGGAGSVVCTDGLDNDCDDLIDDQEISCTACADDQDCDDSNPCNGSEICEQGSCRAGTPLDCDDGNACTNDTCDSLNGCVYTYNHDPCDDGDDCTDNDACRDGTCQGQPRDVDNDGAPSPECGGFDCDDLNAQVHPGAVEMCEDEVDNDCDGDIDSDDSDCDSKPASSGCDCSVPRPGESLAIAWLLGLLLACRRKRP